MPAYNSSETVGEAIESALQQTYRPLEVIVVDDGSDDGTAEVVSQRFGTRVTLLCEPHRGRAAARNRALSAARGSLVQFLDADDLLVPDKVERQAAFLDAHPQFAVAYGETECFSAEDPTVRWRYDLGPAPSGDVLGRMVQDGFVLTCASLARAAWCRAVGGFDEELASNEDWHHWLKIAAAGGLFVHYPGDVVSYYRIQSRGALPQTHLGAGVRALQKIGAQVPREKRSSLSIRRSIGHWRFGFGRALLQHGHRRRGALEMGRALIEDRRSWDYKLAWIVLGTALGGELGGRAVGGIQRSLVGRREAGRG
jgi:glycosyltransferase involved in cell wall biosynthesis